MDSVARSACYFKKRLLAELKATEAWMASLTDRALQTQESDPGIDAMLSVATELKEAHQKRDDLNRQITEHFKDHQC
jgi:hypothetical protein